MENQQKMSKSKKGRYAAGRPRTENVRKIWNYIYDELKDSRENNKISKFSKKIFSCAYFNKTLHIIFFHKRCEIIKSFIISESEYLELKDFIKKASSKFEFEVEEIDESRKVRNFPKELRFIATVCDSEEKV